MSQYMERDWLQYERIKPTFEEKWRQDLWFNFPTCYWYWLFCKQVLFPQSRKAGWKWWLVSGTGFYFRCQFYCPIRCMFFKKLYRTWSKCISLNPSSSLLGKHPCIVHVFEWSLFHLQFLHLWTLAWWDLFVGITVSPSTWWWWWIEEYNLQGGQITFC